MGRPYIKGGTPVGSDSLCRTCSRAHIMTGYRESEQITMCDYVQPTMLVPFNICECTNYWDKNRPTWEQMSKLAIDVVPKTLKPAGFKTGSGFTSSVEVIVGRPDNDDDD